MVVMRLLWSRMHAVQAIVSLPCFWFLKVLFSRRIQQAARKQRKRESAMAATAAEVIGGIKTVQALSLEETFADAFVRRNKASQKQDIKGARLSPPLAPTAGFPTPPPPALL